MNAWLRRVARRPDLCCLLPGCELGTMIGECRPSWLWMLHLNHLVRNLGGRRSLSISIRYSCLPILPIVQPRAIQEIHCEELRLQN
jgi:hypothetical protein